MNVWKTIAIVSIVILLAIAGWFVHIKLVDMVSQQTIRDIAISQAKSGSFLVGNGTYITTISVDQMCEILQGGADGVS